MRDVGVVVRKRLHGHCRWNAVTKGRSGWTQCTFDIQLRLRTYSDGIEVNIPPPPYDIFTHPSILAQCGYAGVYGLRNACTQALPQPSTDPSIAILGKDGRKFLRGDQSTHFHIIVRKWHTLKNVYIHPCSMLTNHLQDWRNVSSWRWICIWLVLVVSNYCLLQICQFARYKLDGPQPTPLISCTIICC